VGFYGTKLKELDGKEFIYKEKGSVKLAAITQRIKKQLEIKYGDTKVVVLANREQVERSMLDPHVLYIQIASLQVYPPEDCVTLFDQHFNSTRFIFEMGFTQGKGEHASDLAKQQKKKRSSSIQLLLSPMFESVLTLLQNLRSFSLQLKMRLNSFREQ